MLAEIQVLPRPVGTDESPYAVVDAAINVIQQSGLNYEVGALGTVVEGEPDRVWEVLRAVHDACKTAGAEHVITNIKIHEAVTGEGATMSQLVGKFR